MNCASWASTASSLEVKEVTSAEAHSCRWTAPSDQTSRLPGRDLFGRDEPAADRRRAAVPAGRRLAPRRSAKRSQRLVAGDNQVSAFHPLSVDDATAPLGTVL